MTAKENNIKAFKLFSSRLLNLKKLCHSQNLNIYDLYKQQKKKYKRANVLYEFALNLMEKLELNELKFENFSTTTLNSGIICLTLNNIPINVLYNTYFKDEYLQLTQNTPIKE